MRTLVFISCSPLYASSSATSLAVIFSVVNVRKSASQKCRFCAPLTITGKEFAITASSRGTLFFYSLAPIRFIADQVA